MHPEWGVVNAECANHGGYDSYCYVEGDCPEKEVSTDITGAHWAYCNCPWLTWPTFTGNLIYIARHGLLFKCGLIRHDIKKSRFLFMFCAHHGVPGVCT